MTIASGMRPRLVKLRLSSLLGLRPSRPLDPCHMIPALDTVMVRVALLGTASANWTV
jgi:hypothetical protein